MTDDKFALRTARLVDINYALVHEAVVPRDIAWPTAIRYEGRIFTPYNQTMPATIEAAQAAERMHLYREIEVWEANWWREPGEPR